MPRPWRLPGLTSTSDSELHEVVNAVRKQRSAAPGIPSPPAAPSSRSSMPIGLHLRVFLGESPLGIARADYASRIALWEEWNDVSIEALGSRQWAASTGSTDP
jgi:hypothetical protein